MKHILAIAITSFILMSNYALADSGTGGAKASSAAGPWVECQLPDGKVDYTPLMICKLQKNGTVK